jgi:hypothetical protein
MTWIDEIQQMGANLVSEFRRIADESEARMQAVEEAHSHNLQTLASLEDRVQALDTRRPPSV